MIRSTDAGRTFAPLPAAEEECNCAVLGVASSATAVIGQVGERLLLLTDGGRHGRAVGPSGNDNYSWASIQFTDPQLGLALRDSEETGRRPNQLWRTTDGGHRWTLVHVM